jgi:hypothetical protein
VAEVLETTNADGALEAIHRFIGSFPLAARTPNRILFAHSLPDVSFIDEYDPRCVDQPPDRLDLSEGSSAYHLVWGRRHTHRVIDRLAAAYDVEYFVIGHQPQEFGYEVVLDRVIILASDNNHGVFLPIDCHRKYDIDALVERIRPFAGVA